MTTYLRSWALDDIAVRSGGDGRTVEAYATPFDVSTEIHDQHGDYEEEIDRASFNRTLSHGIERVGVFYHHGMTLHGTPSDLGSVPLGRPLEIRPDGRGLLTVTRYNKSALADSVLEAIRNGDIRGYSFRGRIFRSDPARIPRARAGQPLPRVRRLELGLTEYGPTPTPAYAAAGIIAVRSAEQLAAQFAGLDETERAALIRALSLATPTDPATAPATPETGPGPEDPREDAHSIRARLLRIKAEMLTPGGSNHG